MIHLQEDINNVIDRLADIFDINGAGIYGKFAVMLGTLSFALFGEHLTDVLPHWLHLISAGITVMAKFFTACVGFIATVKFIKEVRQGINGKKDGK